MEPVFEIGSHYNISNTELFFKILFIRIFHATVGGGNFFLM